MAPGQGAAPRRRTLLGHVAGAGVAVAIVRHGTQDRVAPDSPDRALIDLCARFDALERRVKAMFAPDDPAYIADDERRDAAMMALLDEQDRLVARICAARAFTTDGLMARARSVALWTEDIEQMAGEDSSESWAGRIGYALVRDMVRLPA